MLLINGLRSAEKVFADECLTMKIAYVHLYLVLLSPSESLGDVVTSDVAVYVERTVNSHSLFVVMPLSLNTTSFYSSVGL